jgi:hypothetical protein
MFFSPLPRNQQVVNRAMSLNRQKAALNKAAATSYKSAPQ